MPPQKTKVIKTFEPSENLKKCLKELKIAASFKNKHKREAIMEYLSKKSCIYRALREIAMNIINEEIKLNKSQIERLGPHAKIIKSLQCGVKEKNRKQKLVQQSGGFLPWLIPILTSLVTTGIDLIKK